MQDSHVSNYAYFCLDNKFKLFLHKNLQQQTSFLHSDP